VTQWGQGGTYHKSIVTFLAPCVWYKIVKQSTETFVTSNDQNVVCFY